MVVFFGGNNATVSNVDGRDIYFRGFRNRVAYLKDLMDNHGLSRATDIVVGGCSAGGVAVHLQLDWWRDNLPETSTVKGLPDSGFILDYDSEPGRQASAVLKWLYKQMDFTGDPDCIAAHTPTEDTELCIFAEISAPYVTTPLFALQSQYDSWQLQNLVGSTNPTLVNQFGQALEARFKDTVLKVEGNGCFLDSCAHHCGRWGSIVIDDKNSGEAFSDWYDGQNSLYFQGRPYPCTACCTGGGTIIT